MSKGVSKDIPNGLKEYSDAPLVKDMVLDSKDCSVESRVVVEKKTVVPTIAKVEVIRPKQQEKLVKKMVRYDEMYMSQGPRGNQRNWNNQKSQQLGSHPQKVQEDQGYVDSRCSRHMTGNMSCLSNFKEFDGGYVTFRGEKMVAELLVKELLKL
nr:putative ribonuclease H-like domain-containing protein [Tanacetum cinerariifolium]